MASGKRSTSKPSSPVSGGPSGKMHGFKGAGQQKAGVTGVTSSGGGGKFAKGGPSGKMHGFSGVGAQKPGVSSVSKGKK